MSSTPTKLEEATKGEVGAGDDVQPAISGSSDASAWVKSTSKLRVLLIVSMELVNDMYEHADDGRDKTGSPRGECDFSLVCNRVWLPSE